MTEWPRVPEQQEPAHRAGSRSLFAEFGKERRFWQLSTALFCAFAVLKGLRAPGLWPLTQAEIDYSHGFIKRGLQGEILSLLHIHHYHALSAFFFVQLGCLFLVLGIFTRLARVPERFGSLAPVAVFASSYAITFLTHIVGYTDIPLAALTVVLLCVREPRRRFWAAVLLVPLALLVHESFLLMFLPVLLFSFILDALLTSGPARKRILVLGGVLALLSLAITLAFSVRGNLSPEEVDRFQEEIETRVDFDLRDDFFNVLSRPLSGSVREAIDGIHYADWFVPDLVSLVNLLPPVLLLLYLMRRLVRSAMAEDQHARKSLWVAATMAAAAPLIMYLLGVDGGRWNTTCALVIYLELLLLCRSLPPGTLRLTPAQRNAVIFVLAINMASGMGLFDDETIHPFPFVPALSERYR